MDNIDAQPDEGQVEKPEEITEQEEVKTPQAPPAPQYNESDVKQMIQQYLQSEEAKKRAEEDEKLMDELYKADKEEYARVARQKQEAEKIAAKAREDAQAEYYTTIFRELAPQWQPYLSAMSEEEKRYYHPENPMWRSDAQYIAALSGKVAELKAKSDFEKFSQEQGKTIKDVAKEVVEDSKKVTPNLPASSEGAPINPLSRSSRDVLTSALKETVGTKYTPGGWDDDYSD